jgi:uncharacterized protein YndB with AHSA1/START domain
VLGLASFIIVALALQEPALTAPAPFQPAGFTAAVSVEIEAPRAEVFAAATGDVRPWWDHSFVETPAELVIEAEMGGRFFERFEAGGSDGALHARIIYVDAPETLRLHGPLGLSGQALDLVTTWTLTETETGTRFDVALNMQGEIDADTAVIIQAVWLHFISARLKPYVEAGCHRAPDVACHAWD